MWYVVLTKSRQEQRAAANLSNQSGEVYLPMLKIVRIKNGKRTQQEEPLFPGYLFLKKTDNNQLVSKVRSTYGVRGLLRFGEQPVSVANQLIEDIRQRTVRALSPPELKPGQHVQLAEGPFKDYQAIFHSYKGKERAIILINLLGQQNHLLVELGQIT